MTVLRCANVLGPDVETGVHPDARAAGGADGPRLRPAAAVRPRGRRRPRARARGAQRPARDLQRRRRRRARALGGDLARRPPAAAAPAAGRAPGCVRAPLRRLGFRMPDEMANLLRFGRGVDNRLYKATGFDYGFTSREAVIRLGEHLRLRADPARRAGEEGYVYEREVEEFLRWSPHVRRERAAARARAPTASRSESEAADCSAAPALRRRLVDARPTLSSSPWRASFQIGCRLPGRGPAAGGGGRVRLGLVALGRDRRRGDDRRRRRRRDDRRRGDPAPSNAKLVKPLRQAGHRRPTTGSSTSSAPRSSSVDSDVDGMVDQALEESQRGRPADPRLALRHRRRGRRRDLAAGHLLQRRDRRVHRQGRRPRSTPTR